MQTKQNKQNEADEYSLSVTLSSLQGPWLHSPLPLLSSLS